MRHLRALVLVCAFAASATLARAVSVLAAPNPCQGTAPTCTNFRLGYNCGYGSTCVGTSHENGTCLYVARNLTAGERCSPLVDDGLYGQHSLQTTACINTQCTRSTLGEYEMCQTPGTGIVGCECDESADDAVDECTVAGLSCFKGICSLKGSGLVGNGLACEDGLDCISGNCTNSICIGRPENATCDSSEQQCAKGYYCYPVPPTSGICQPARKKGEACGGFGGRVSCESAYLDCDFRVPISNFTCIDKYFGKDEGLYCTSKMDCKPGLTCRNELCTTNTTCGDATGSTTCPFGQVCACNGTSTDPICTGQIITQTCATAYQELAKCLFVNRDVSPSSGFSGLEVFSLPVPEICKPLVATVYCTEECSGPLSALATERVYIDYNLIDCGTHEFVLGKTDYSTKPHNLMCGVGYKPGKFGAVNTTITPTGTSSPSSTTTGLSGASLGLTITGSVLGGILVGVVGILMVMT